MKGNETKRSEAKRSENEARNGKQHGLERTPVLRVSDSSNLDDSFVRPLFIASELGSNGEEPFLSRFVASRLDESPRTGDESRKTRDISSYGVHS